MTIDERLALYGDPYYAWKEPVCIAKISGADESCDLPPAPSTTAFG